jgi:hypothetical protein
VPRRDREDLRAGDFFDVFDLERVARDFVVDERLGPARFVGVLRFFVVVFREPAFLVVFFAGAFFDLVLVDRRAPLRLVRVVRFFAVVLRGPDFLAVVRLDRAAGERLAPLALARVRRFRAGAFAFFAGARLVLPVCLMVKPVPDEVARRKAVPAVAGSGCGGPPSAAISSVAPGAPKARRPARQPAIVSAPRP